jgi:1-acyl-sn-glycerol-3-phosphate acyltransferase
MLPISLPSGVTSRDAFRPSFFLAFGALMHRSTRIWFRFSLRGWERLPTGPVIFVGNHSAIGVADILCMLGAWRTRFGLSRRCVGMMHDLFVRFPIVGRMAQGFGAVPANPRAAREAIARGHDVICFPGGDIDSCRPFTAAREVRFGRRRGYVRLALETGLPIVPLATIGSHWSYLILPGGETVARILGLRRWTRNTTWPITVGGVAAAVVIALVLASALPAWAIIVALVAMLLPTPVRVTTEMLEPIDICAATAHLEDPAARIEAAHLLVHGALVSAVGTMGHRT